MLPGMRWTMAERPPERVDEQAPQIADAHAFLARHHCLSLATNGPDGLWASTVFYVNAGFDLYFLSRAGTRHVRNLEVDPRVAGTVNDDVADWVSIRGIQLEGRAELVGEGRRREVLEMFSLHYAFPDVIWWDADQTAPRAAQRIYRIRPSRLLFIDHGIGSGRLDVPLESLEARGASQDGCSPRT